MARYQEVIIKQEPSWALAALARMGQLNSAVADRVGAVPPGVKPGPRRDALCRAATAAAAPFRSRARDSFTDCLQLAMVTQWYDGWRATCAWGIDEEAPADIAPHPGFITLAIPQAPAVLQERRQGK
jgi:hypothetical protein